MQKNSFTLIETLVSITLLLIVIIGFKYSTYYDENSSKNFMLLNNLENLFDTKNYGSFQNSTKTLQLIKNKEIIENITVTKYQFENENIKLFKYEK
ncbi:type IV pilus modification PilV family protein [Aliarcobacter butzleri]|uniref:Prepilin-type N-terminal cleavage/methylation domain-containing protein n=1 Tax=Aliarcobacter butzleri TaxID=28197 RepID=A0AAW6VGT4_9BACT|nr:prepilin-type N-terminal cleavage/methylation domain-containing protein [Aliarcobacter butzleri]MDK2041394.1 prepilin-type N-terminal cleavage/methylation domain-containing protein [Aliarcobacter butzleri]MDK2096482.1 prepilin-type N-terminal cleavage/methylation domain-containing protein [Aliarcobacter butzleri]